MNSSISSSSGSPRANKRQVQVFLVLLLVLLAAALVFVEYEIRQSPLEGKIAAYRAKFAAAPAGMPVFGDSHVESAFKVALVDGTKGAMGRAGTLQDFGWPGFTLMESQAMANAWFARHGFGPFILQADPHLFAPYRLGDVKTARPDLLAGSDREVFRFLSPVHRPYLMAWLREGIRAKLDFGPPPVPLDEQAIIVRDEEALIRAQQHEPLPGPARDAAMAAYRKFVAGVMARGAQPCLVSFPVHGAYRRGVESRDAYDQVFQFFQGLAAQHGLRYIDARAWLQDQYFVDPDHMSTSGSRIFLARLEQACALP